MDLGCVALRLTVSSPQFTARFFNWWSNWKFWFRVPLKMWITISLLPSQHLVVPVLR